MTKQKEITLTLRIEQTCPVCGGAGVTSFSPNDPDCPEDVCAGPSGPCGDYLAGATCQDGTIHLGIDSFDSWDDARQKYPDYRFIVLDDDAPQGRWFGDRDSLGLPNGLGVWYTPHGDLYVGTVKDGAPHGRGVLYAQSSHATVSGDWHEGQQHGEISYTDTRTGKNINYIA
tara:strand:- start:1321 stop:1836 length:516 start_codon:yes stop_codon:yes gene_type:complete